MEKEITQELTQLSAKVARLNRERWLWRISLLLVVAGLILTGAVAKTPVTDELRVEKIVLVDDIGVPQALLSSSPIGPILSFLDVSGQGVLLSMSSTGPSLTLSGSQGQVSLRSSSKTGPSLTFSDSQNRLRAELGVSGIGPRLTLYDEQ